MMQFWLEKGPIDCAVVVCEGAGTVLTFKGSLVQAIGARLAGIGRTSPIPEIITRIRKEGGMVLEHSQSRHCMCKRFENHSK
jgi:hypothetical protein